jgi:hypothetical protein
MKWFDEITQEIKSKEEHISKAWIIKKLEVIKNRLLNDFKDQIQYFNSTKVLKPTHIQKYDVVYTSVCGVPHPVLIFKVEDKYAYGIVLSSTKGTHCLYEIKNSRFFKGSCSTITLVKADVIISIFKKHITSVV